MEAMEGVKKRRSAKMTSPATKERIILDCDPGYDDAAALILAAGSPALNSWP